MDQNVIDLRSDTVTRPTPAMLDIMMSAPVGDDVYGDDPSVNQLESEVAKILGMESALFVPSGTMANQIAIHLHTRPGDSVITEVDSHCFIYEAGGAAALSGVQFDLLPRAERFADAAIDKAVRVEGIHSATTSLVVVENTHNRGGGRVLSAAEMARIAARAHKHHLKAHCDGARLWNAAVQSNVEPRDLVCDFDSVAVCFSKGLGAPVGSALVGSRDFIGRARKVRKRWGGGMRQAGFLAAAALFAVQHQRVRLADDHRSARAFAEGLLRLKAVGVPVECDLEGVETNIVYFSVPRQAERIAQALAKLGVLINPVNDTTLRIVTHLHVTASAVDRSLSAIKAMVLSV